jgi:hypothetical protein
MAAMAKNQRWGGLGWAKMSAPQAPHVIAAIDEVLRNGGGTEEIIATLMK